MNVAFQDQNFTVTEASAHLRIGRTVFYRLVAEGKLRPIKIGGRTIVTGAELVRFRRAAEEAAAAL